MIIWTIFIFLLCSSKGYCYKQIFDKPVLPGTGSDKIVNGTRVQRRDLYPAQALLYYRNWYRCGGTIIDEYHVITAAHCVINDPSQRRGYFTIAVGKFKLKTNIGTEQFRVISKVYVHKDYRRISYFHDIALLRFDTPLVFTRKVKPANLSTSEDDQRLTNGKTCYATGFGLVKDNSNKLANVLQEIKTNIISRNKCAQLADDLYGLGSQIYKGTVCTLDEDSGVCQGDSGGPVGCFDFDGTFYQVGVLSWGSPLCTEGFNVFIRISKYRKWIKTITSRVG